MNNHLPIKFDGQTHVLRKYEAGVAYFPRHVEMVTAYTEGDKSSAGFICQEEWGSGWKPPIETSQGALEVTLDRKTKELCLSSFLVDSHHHQDIADIKPIVWCQLYRVEGDRLLEALYRADIKADGGGVKVTGIVDVSKYHRQMGEQGLRRQQAPPEIFEGGNHAEKPISDFLTRRVERYIVPTVKIDSW